MELEPLSYRGLDALRVRSGRIELVIIPAWGGKIASLVDLERQREWLHTNPHVPYRLPEYDANYVLDFDAGGFDECFPNIGSGFYPQAPWRGVEIPDHGEIWALPWTVTPTGDALEMSVHGVRLPYRFTRWLSFPEEGKLVLSYRLENPTPFAMPFVWSSHPIFEVTPGMRIDIPPGRMRVDNGRNNFPAATGCDISWPRHNGLDLDVLPPHEAGWAVKLFTRDLREGWVQLSDPAGGANLRMEFDPQRVTHVGLWMNYHGWAGIPGASKYYNLAIEPCIGVADRLDIAMQEDACGLLPAQGSLEWWLSLSVA